MSRKRYRPRVPLTREQRPVLKLRQGRWHVFEGHEAHTLSDKKRTRVVLEALRHARKLNADPSLLKGSRK